VPCAHFVKWGDLISEPHVFPLYPRKGVAVTTGEQWAQSMRAIAITGAEGGDGAS